MSRCVSFVLCLAVLVLGAVRPAWAEQPPVRVVATMSILADMVTRVGGPRVEVHTLVGPDGDTHVFQPSPSDARAMAGADLVVMNGLDLEGWMERLVAASGYKGRVVVAAAKVKPREFVEEADAGHDHDHDHDHAADPHAWQDLANGRLYVAEIARGLAAASPADAELFKANARAYDAELAELDAWVRATLGAVPAAKRRVITSHDAFGYFGAAYGVEFLAPAGLATDAEPSAGALGGLIRQMRGEGIKALFVENVTDPRLVEMLARETGAVLGGALYSDALSKPGGAAETYVAMFRHNATTLAEGMRRN
jgi:zinc/manganese transport system substrate-binding protein